MRLVVRHMGYDRVLYIAGMCYRDHQDREEVFGHVETWGFNPRCEDLERAFAELEKDRKSSLKDGRTVTLGMDRGKWVINEFDEPEFVKEGESPQDL